VKNFPANTPNQRKKKIKSIQERFKEEDRVNRTHKLNSVSRGVFAIERGKKRDHRKRSSR
jgi:hypothetical protein